MTTSLNNFRDRCLDGLLDLLWRQWTAVGVAGQMTASATGRVIDPEALLALTCTIGRYDARLFDEVLDWLAANERFLNVQRLKNVVEGEGFAARTVLPAVAEILGARGKTAKWRRMAADGPDDIGQPRPFFYRRDGQPLPLVGDRDEAFAAHGWQRNPVQRVRALSGEFPRQGTASLWLRLRALFGINARCEILLYLLTADRTGAAEVACQTYYFPRTVQDALGEMLRSGLVVSHRSGREHLYSLADPRAWQQLLRLAERPEWVCWPALFAGLERVWLTLQADDFAAKSADLQVSRLRQCLHQGAADKFARSGLHIAIPDAEHRPGTAYGDDLVAALDTLLQQLNSGA